MFRALPRGPERRLAFFRSIPAGRLEGTGQLQRSISGQVLPSTCSCTRSTPSRPHSVLTRESSTSFCSSGGLGHLLGQQLGHVHITRPALQPDRADLQPLGEQRLQPRVLGGRPAAPPAPSGPGNRPRSAGRSAVHSPAHRCRPGGNRGPRTAPSVPPPPRRIPRHRRGAPPPAPLGSGAPSRVMRTASIPSTWVRCEDNAVICQGQIHAHPAPRRSGTGPPTATPS